MRAARFQHQSHRNYQALVDRDLLRISRGTETSFEVSVRLTNATTDLTVGSPCLVRERDGRHEVLHGNIVVARLAPEAQETLAACMHAAPSLSGMIPCRVSRVGSFGGVSLTLDAGGT